MPVASLRALSHESYEELYWPLPTHMGPAGSGGGEAGRPTEDARKILATSSGSLGARPTRTPGDQEAEPPLSWSPEPLLTHPPGDLAHPPHDGGPSDYWISVGVRDLPRGGGGGLGALWGLFTGLVLFAGIGLRHRDPTGLPTLAQTEPASPTGCSVVSCATLGPVAHGLPLTLAGHCRGVRWLIC